MDVVITSDSPFVVTAPGSESTGTSQQIDLTLPPTVTITGENVRLLAS